MFQPIEGNVNFPKQEEEILRFWKENRIYQKSLDQRAGAPPFVFYEGPPTANGMPHPGHCLTRAIKDLFPRYKTMRGYRCERKAGWDTHGLPVEVEVCKELGIHAKEEIEAHGIEDFIQKCQQSVWRYMQEWERLTERIGFWVDLEKAYVTYHQSYVESVWWSLKNLFDRGLLYQGHKIVWWWAQGGTALSAGEVGLGYREVADPSVYVKFPLNGNRYLERIINPPDLKPYELSGDIRFEPEQIETELDDASLLIWTTTPWTLPANEFVAVNPTTQYCLVEIDGERLIIAKGLVEAVAARKKAEAVFIRECSGRDLLGYSYKPPFENYSSTIGSQNRGKYWRVISADFVTTDGGTGLVHIAPAFGEDDYQVLINQNNEFVLDPKLQLFCPVAPDGKFTDEAPEYLRGRWVKDCDKDIIRDLKQRGLLFHQEQYLHEYPFCWRAEQDPLIQYPRNSWFIRTTDYKDAMLENNSKINWLPEHIKTGRFGKFLESNVDWALSRERYWATPLPIWKCEETGKYEAIGSYEELLAKPGVTGTEVWDAAKKKNPELPDDLRVHKPYIDAVTYDSPFTKGAKMQRVPDVIDAWYDSGSMPFAQWGYKGENRQNNAQPNQSHSGSLPSAGRAGEGGDAATNAAEKFHSQFPADFISEAIDQTRGWFYSQLAISTMLFSEEQGAGSKEKDSSELPAPSSSLPAHYPHPFRNCIVLGLMLGEDGQKMSKSKRNYLPPSEIFNKYGADALRWYFFANQPPWTTIRYSEQAIKDSIPEFLLRLWNCYSFFVIYANIDEFDPREERGARSEEQGASKPSSSLLTSHSSLPAPRSLPERSELDRWILSELNRTCAAVVERMDVYDNYGAAQHITAFVDALSNWYVRRSRDRFWAADKRDPAKLDAYWTLYECLLTTAKLVAPFVPFLAETLWQNLLRGARSEERGASDSLRSVHLEDYPTGDAAIIDEALSARMSLVRLISSLGRNARTSAALKVRQPLEKVEVILADTTHQGWLEAHADVIKEELNVKKLEFCDDPTLYVEHEVNPNFKLLGPKLGKLMPKVKAWLGKQSGAELLANIRDNGLIDLEIEGEKLALTREEVEVRIKPRPGWTSANDRGVVVVLSTELTPELIEEGIANDVVRLIQDRRKDSGCEYTDRIEIGIVTQSSELRRAVERFRDHIMAETLAEQLIFEPLPSAEGSDAKVGEARLNLLVKIVGRK